ncbi:MAG: PrsW family glutamic-type intramembrane protease [Phycisphaerales bacterium]
MTLSTICLYLTLAACGVLCGVLIIKYDLYRREPWHLVLAAVALGALGMFGAGELQIVLIRAINASGSQVSNTTLALLAGVTEEAAKFLVVLVIATRRSFDEPLDGIIFGSLAGLGAALDESVYYLNYGAPPEYLPPQEPIRLAGHLIMGGIAGFGLGPLRLKVAHGAAWAAGAFLAAVALHVAWDLVAFSASDHHHRTGKLTPWHTVLPMALITLGMLTYRHLITVGARMTRVHLKLDDAGAPA